MSQNTQQNIGMMACNVLIEMANLLVFNRLVLYWSTIVSQLFSNIASHDVISTSELYLDTATIKTARSLPPTPSLNHKPG